MGRDRVVSSAFSQGNCSHKECPSVGVETDVADVFLQKGAAVNCWNCAAVNPFLNHFVYVLSLKKPSIQVVQGCQLGAPSRCESEV